MGLASSLSDDRRTAQAWQLMAGRARGGVATVEAPVAPNRIVLVEMPEDIEFRFWNYPLSFVLGLRCIAAHRADSGDCEVGPGAPGTQRSRDVLFEAAA